MYEELESEIQSIYESYASEKAKLNADSDELEILTNDRATLILQKMQAPLRSAAIKAIRSIDQNNADLQNLENNNIFLDEDVRIVIKRSLKKYDKDHVGKKKKIDSFYKYARCAVWNFYKTKAEYEKYDRVKELPWVQDDREDKVSGLKKSVPNGKKKFTSVVRKIDRLKKGLNTIPYDLKEDEKVRLLVNNSRRYTEEQIKDLLEIIEITNLEVLSPDEMLFENRNNQYIKEESIIYQEDYQPLIKAIIMDFIRGHKLVERYILENYADNKEKIHLGNESFTYMDYFVLVFERDPLSLQSLKDKIFEEFNENWDCKNIKRQYRRLLSELNIKMSRLISNEYE